VVEDLRYDKPGDDRLGEKKLHDETTGND